TAARTVRGLIDPGVVHEHRWLSQALRDKARGCFDRFAPGDVALEALERVAGPLRQILEPGSRHCVGDIECGDAGTSFNERVRPHRTQLAAGTGHDGDAVVERKASVHRRVTNER